MDYQFRNIEEGSEYTQDYTITEDVYQALVTVFRDQSPIHVDQEYAVKAGFKGRVMHGAILQGFLSHFVGMHFPGERSLLLSAHVNYRRPSYLGDEIRVTATVRQKVETGQVIVLAVNFFNRTTDEVVASGKVQVAMRDE